MMRRVLKYAIEGELIQAIQGILLFNSEALNTLVIQIKEILTNINPLFRMGHKSESKTLGIPSNSRYINKPILQ